MHLSLETDHTHKGNFGELKISSAQMKASDFVSNTRYVLNDVEEEQKEKVLGHQCEKLANTSRVLTY